MKKPQWDKIFADRVGLSEEKTVKKYEHLIIFRNVDFPEAEKPLTVYCVGDFYVPQMCLIKAVRSSANGHYLVEFTSDNSATSFKGLKISLVNGKKYLV